MSGNTEQRPSEPPECSHTEHAFRGQTRMGRYFLSVLHRHYRDEGAWEPCPPLTQEEGPR